MATLWKSLSSKNKRWRDYLLLIIRFLFILSIVFLLLLSLATYIKAKYFDLQYERVGIFLDNVESIWYSNSLYDGEYKCDLLSNDESPQFSMYTLPLRLSFRDSPASITAYNGSKNTFDVIIGGNEEYQIHVTGFSNGKEVISIDYSDGRRLHVLAKRLEINHPKKFDLYDLRVCGQDITYWPATWSFGFHPDPASIETQFGMQVDDVLTINVTDVTSIVELMLGGDKVTHAGRYDTVKITIHRTSQNENPGLAARRVSILMFDIGSLSYFSPGTDQDFKDKNPETKLLRVYGESNGFTLAYPKGRVELRDNQINFGDITERLYIKAAGDGQLHLSQDLVTRDLISIVGWSNSATLDGQPVFQTEWEKLPNDLKTAYLGFLYSFCATALTLIFNKRKSIIWFLFKPISSRAALSPQLQKGYLIIYLTSGKIIAGSLVKKNLSMTKGSLIIANPIEKHGDSWELIHNGEINIPVEKIDFRYFFNG